MKLQITFVVVVRQVWLLADCKHIADVARVRVQIYPRGWRSGCKWQHKAQMQWEGKHLDNQRRDGACRSG